MGIAGRERTRSGLATSMTLSLSALQQAAAQRSAARAGTGPPLASASRALKMRAPSGPGQRAWTGDTRRETTGQRREVG